MFGVFEGELFEQWLPKGGVKGADPAKLCRHDCDFLFLNNDMTMLLHTVHCVGAHDCSRGRRTYRTSSVRTRVKPGFDRFAVF